MNSHWTALNTTEFSYQIWSCPIFLLKPKRADWLMCFRLLRWIFMSLFWLVCRNLMGSYEFVLWWCVELSRSMAAILEMPQYVAYQKNVIYAFIKLSAKSHSFNILFTMDGLSCPTITLSHIDLVAPIAGTGKTVSGHFTLLIHELSL